MKYRYPKKAHRFNLWVRGRLSRLQKGGYVEEKQRAESRYTDRFGRPRTRYEYQWVRLK